MPSLAGQRAGGAARATQQRAAALAAYQANPPLCGHCGQTTPLPPRGAAGIREARRKKYCNTRCAGFANASVPRARNRKPTRCACGTVGGVRYGQCATCRRKPRVDTIGGRTKGALFSGSSSWQSARSTIQKRARKAYAASGLPMVCSVCGYNKHVEIAHRLAVSDWPQAATIDQINEVNNLMALCPNHHWEQEHGLVVAGPGFEPEVSTL